MAVLDAHHLSNGGPAPMPGFDLVGAAAGDIPGLELLKVPSLGPAAGPPLLFVHGMFHGAWCWREMYMPFFAMRGYDTYAVSLRDHGQSTRTADPRAWHLADYVKDVAWAVDRIGRKPILIGHSLGGTIVQKLLETDEYPGVALLAPSPIGGSNQAAVKMMARHPASMLRAVLKRDLNAALPAFVDSFFSRQMPKAQVREYTARMNGRTSFLAAEDAYYKDCPKPEKKGTPVLVVAGERDWSIPMAKHEALAEGWGGELRTAPCAHDMMLDVEWEASARIVLDWLRRIGNNHTSDTTRHIKAA
jgi:pimeloyl-ACP methyl ester carboxylesterase